MCNSVQPLTIAARRYPFGSSQPACARSLSAGPPDPSVRVSQRRWTRAAERMSRATPEEHHEGCPHSTPFGCISRPSRTVSGAIFGGTENPRRYLQSCFPLVCYLREISNNPLPLLDADTTDRHAGEHSAHIARSRRTLCEAPARFKVAFHPPAGSCSMSW